MLLWESEVIPWRLASGLLPRPFWSRRFKGQSVASACPQKPSNLLHPIRKQQQAKTSYAPPPPPHVTGMEALFCTQMMRKKTNQPLAVWSDKKKSKNMRESRLRSLSRVRLQREWHHKLKGSFYLNFYSKNNLLTPAYCVNDVFSLCKTLDSKMTSLCVLVIIGYSDTSQ